MRLINRTAAVWAGAMLVLCSVSGCKSTYYSMMEGLGIHKREILVDRVEEARDAQTEAKEQFTSALDQFRSVVAFDGGDLEELYDDLQKQLDRSQDRAEEVTERIESVESVAEALFDEWDSELDDYSSKERRRDSKELLDQTKDRYERVMVAMRRAREAMDPVLAAFNDQVLVLKHNLNARAITGLEGELDSIEREVAVLIADMESAIQEASTFIASMS